MVKRWSSAKKAIAAPSSGADLYAATRAPSEVTDVSVLAQYFGEDLGICAYEDAQANIGISHLSGLGTERPERQEIGPIKIGGCDHQASAAGNHDEASGDFRCRSVSSDAHPKGVRPEVCVCADVQDVHLPAAVNITALVTSFCVAHV